MAESRPVSAVKGKRPLLSSGLVLSRISAPISILAAFQRIGLADANAFGELRLRDITSHSPDAGDLHIADPSQADRTFSVWLVPFSSQYPIHTSDEISRIAWHKQVPDSLLCKTASLNAKGFQA